MLGCLTSLGGMQAVYSESNNNNDNYNKFDIFRIFNYPF